MKTDQQTGDATPMKDDAEREAFLTKLKAICELHGYFIFGIDDMRASVVLARAEKPEDIEGMIEDLRK